MSENPGPYIYVLSQAQLDDQFGEWLNSPQFIAAVEIAANAYHEDECVYHAERDAARAALDRVRVLADGLPDAPRVRLIRANLRAGLDGWADD